MKPKVHIFSHIHESYGVYLTKDTLFINAAQCGARRVLLNNPITILYKSNGKF